MNKAELKAKWSQYCDTDNLVDNVRALLNKYGHRNSEHGVCVVLDKYFEQKEQLIKLFVTSKNYIGNMRIVINEDFERELDHDAIYKFCANFCKAIDAFNFMKTDKDADGKTLTDYLLTGIKSGNIKGIELSARNAEKVAAFTDLGITAESEQRYFQFEEWIDDFKYITQHNFSGYKEMYGVEVKKGTKTSRAFNKVCAHFGIDKAKQYNKLFAQYADLVADGTRHLHFVISLNPLDYLTMSFGPNWKSCHNIYGGGYMGGCVSYMLDKVSFITYVVDNINEPIHSIPKIYRQMFYYNDNLFIQSRLYPQGKDGATDLYEKFRVIVQNEFVNILGLSENAWSHISNNDCRGVVREFSTNTGFHYPDASSRGDCGIFYPTEKENEMQNPEKINIGHESLCFYCGGSGSMYSDQLSHHSCSISTTTQNNEDDFDWN